MSKEILLGNDAVARGLYEAGVCFASSYPGTPSTEITEKLAECPEIYCEWAPNEKVALESAFGASLAGRRAFTAMKHVGLNVAADPLFTLSYTGVSAGLVVAVADDPGMHSSQNEQDTRNYGVAAKLPVIEPSDSQECLEFTKYAYELSEKFDTPVILRLITRISHSQSIAETGERVLPPIIPYEKKIPKYVMMPGAAKARHPIVEQRQRDLAELGTTTPLNRTELVPGAKIGIITSGTAYQYIKESAGDQISVLKLGLVWPLPEKLIADFAAKHEHLIICEELDPVIERSVRAMGISVCGKTLPNGEELFPLCGELFPNAAAVALEKAAAYFGVALSVQKHSGAAEPDAVPARPPVMCAGCPHRGMFYVLSKLGVTVLGDIGCYTLGAMAPLFAIDTAVCMGASVSGLHGFTHAPGNEKAKLSACVIGDSTFMHSGITGLVNTAYNGGSSTVIILDNSITGMTGHQQNPTTGLNIKGEPAGKIDLEALVRAIGIRRIVVVDPYDLAACEKAVREETAADEPSVIISRRPCALLKTVKAKPPLCVDTEKCKACRACLKIGCPAVSFKNGKAEIDRTLCVGCGVCTQMCKFEAIG
ncbi:MAG: indolepyruvate ferredoxin oxidoreductase subunit alpha [Oscillospiraceae bacterium]|jgi:indolepyruvate ferredoxin oxidoreductase alpha subunit|nr:indolepyruvate ferredoxin oxidoreductase subunit alpha [Oscillospiraceae bacterium]